MPETPIPEWAIRDAKQVASNFCNTDSMAGGMWVETIARALVEVREADCQILCPRCSQNGKPEFVGDIWRHKTENGWIECRAHLLRAAEAGSGIDEPRLVEGLTVGESDG